MTDPSPTTPRNPYPGLRPFRPDEEHLFFGRERQTDRMVDKLAARRFLAVVGTSGSGKSSLVNCGLRPALHRGFMTRAGADWRMASCRPGHDPIDALAQALAAPDVLFGKPLGDAMSTEELVLGTLRMSGLGLVDIVRQARLPRGSNLLVVVDQFEELFRFQGRADAGGPDSQGPGPQATAFVKLLLEAVAQDVLPIYVVLTMRSDYLGDCAQFHGLPEIMNEGQYLVPRLSRDEIRAAISGPATLAQAQVSPVLLTRLLNDVGDNPDQLSILQHALNRTWAYWETDGRREGPLDLAHYEAIGGMQSALDRHAEKAFGELADPGAPAGRSPRQQMAARVFRALTDKGTDPRGIRRPTALADLCAITGASPAELEAVMAVFRRPSRSFLMPPEGEALLPGTRIDISHESLMRVWKRLDRWADEEAAAARQYRRLAESAEMFGRDEAGLLSDRELDLALAWQWHATPNAAWAMQYGGRFELVDAFIRRSREVRLAERVGAEIDLRWRTHGRLVLIGAVALLFVVLQIAAADTLDGWLWERMARLFEVYPRASKALVQLMSHVAVGLPSLLIYDALEPRLRLRHAARVRDAVSREVADAAEAPVPMAVPVKAPTAAGTPAPTQAASADAAAHVVNPARLAGPARRLLAAMIDLGVAMFLAFSMLFVLEVTGVAAADAGRAGLGLMLVVLLIGVISARALSSARQATLGKRLLGLVVVDREGRRLGFGRAYVRYLLKCLSYWPLCGLGWLPLLAGRQHRPLPDWLGRTWVLRREDKPAA
jgi:uncharacterized RDD family membrane protein YckC